MSALENVNGRLIPAEKAVEEELCPRSDHPAHPYGVELGKCNWGLGHDGAERTDHDGIWQNSRSKFPQVLTEETRFRCGLLRAHRQGSLEGILKDARVRIRIKPA